MKNKIILLAMLVMASLSNAQVGINTPTPASTLDITAKNATGASTNIDGLLIPRVDRQRAQGMTGTPISTLIYVNNVSTGTQTGTAVNIDIVGYYYYNGTAWTKLNAAGANTNIYNTDGSLTDNRTVSQGSNTLAFTTNQVNGFSVDGSTLSVDAANNRIGMGSSAPQNRLDLGSDVGTDNTAENGKKLALYNNPVTGDDFYGLGIGPNTLQFHASSQKNEAPQMVLNSLGNAGIGTGNIDPRYKLDLGQATIPSRVLGIHTDFANGDGFYGFGMASDRMDFYAGYSAALGQTNPRMVIIGSSGSVGIGTTSPSSLNKLEVIGNVKATSFISNTQTYPDYVFESYYKGGSNINPDYKFVKLDDVEHFIKKNGHLPGYESIDEIKKKDFTIDISKNTITNMEKIEELYLHLIDLKKEIEKLKKENKELKKSSNK